MSNHLIHEAPSARTKRPPRIIPTQGRVVVEPMDDNAAGAAGLIIAGREQMRAQMGRIVELPAPNPTMAGWLPADEDEEQEDEWKVGDVILFGPNAGHSIDVGYGHARVRCLIMRTVEILAKVEQDDD